ncbi:chitinase [Diaporthe helianthi]|uniref:chitinase n=1 Tax=Diaporthe helianthi TaxID=158607 RepID=A0A2P5HR59_DIAHE|nr:chitinase [Diaporthe helianthi]
MCAALSVPPFPMPFWGLGAIDLTHDEISGILHGLNRRASTSGQGDYTCAPGKPCSNGACCGESGWCGYSPTYCGDGCQSNCDAKAECGEDAATPGQTCPLNVCCSEFGFCGTTTLFCQDGCQSNCEQPEPSGGGGNVQQRIIGYWEGWNYQHPCGTMTIGQVPVNMLTHLIVAFGYINHAFQVTNMDGLSTDVYKNVGNLKSRNPDLKVMIALGGWTFSDPGTWQSVFPTLVSTQANRATFITNLLGFLSEYGYDGVDFDWEYPGADDRGGSDVDGKSYTALLKELKAAIAASGRHYIVTFTAPTSYWYLRHFDVKNMAENVDWINLMAYDLHGVWDGDNPIGNQVLSHTNLTEIDLALDLFWRVDVPPSSIVLGLGFYGRSFKLTDPSCWKPGCSFSGPGDAGRCTNTAGILSYREVSDILDSTGATAYLDEEAAARYLVYGDGSWISYDDATTFKAKIDYANKMGLSGLMIWAIDLDNNNLEALRAITGDTKYGSDDLFDLVDLKYLFPQEILPTDTSPKYGLISFGGQADTMDPSQSAFGFVLIAGDSSSVANLKKRSGQPEPFTFLDCPKDVLGLPDKEVRTARVVCLSHDTSGCFQVMIGGVEGTVVEMPDNCAGNTFARAISLVISADQQVPAELERRDPTAKVYEFSFDFNFDLMRRDSEGLSVRIDYSNVRGYWDTIVDAPGIQARDISNIEDRFFAPTKTDWQALYAKATDSDEFNYNPNDKVAINEDISAPMYWQTATECPVDGQDYDEGFGAYVEGRVDATFYYGFSMVAKLEGSDFGVKEANGFLTVRGQTDLTYGMGGIGKIDIARAMKGNPAFNQGNPVKLDGNTVSAGSSNGWVSFNPYYEVVYQMASMNGTNQSPSTAYQSEAAFNGLMSTRVVTDLGRFNAYFPSPVSDETNSQNDHRDKNKISVGEDNVLYDSPGVGGQIALGTYLKFGLKVDIFLFSTLFKLTIGAPDMSLWYNTLALFTFYPDEAKQTACTEYEVITNIYSDISDSDTVNWEDEHVQLAYDRQGPSQGKVCYPIAESSKRRRRGEDVLPRVPELPTRPGKDVNSTVLAHAERPIDLLSPASLKRATARREAKDSDLVAMYDASLDRRQSTGSMPMPGWGYEPGISVDPNDYLPAAERLFDKSEPKFKCKDCGDCAEDDSDIKRCCGCASMDYRYQYYEDMPNCESCNPDDETDGYWPGNIFIGKRDATGNETGSDLLDDDELTDENSYHLLEERAQGVATLSYKKVRVCGTRYWGVGDYRYPAFPLSPNNPWETTANALYVNGISSYWGNSSDSCSAWGTTNRRQADTVIIPSASVTPVRVRAKYNTEHVFEGQLIGDFFSQWLHQGRINNQNPAPVNPQSKMDCFVTQTYITAANPANFPWQLDGQPASFMQLMLAELGSIRHLDRLTIYQARPNRKKGSMFSGNQPTDPRVYELMSKDEQLQSVKEMGLVFTYLNTQQVWDGFCGSYEALYDLLGRFDTWYASNGAAVAIPNLQDEWKQYIRVVLDSMVRRSKATFDYMYQNRRVGLLGGFVDPPYTGHWIANRFINRLQIRLALTCRNMDASRA